MRISDWSSDVCLPISYSFNNREGFSRNETLGRKVADQESHFVRGKIKYEGDAFDIVLSGDYNKITGHEQLIQLAAYNPAVFSGPLAGFLGAMDPDRTLHRKSGSEESREGKECVSTVRTRWSRYH